MIKISIKEIIRQSILVNNLNWILHGKISNTKHI